MSISKQVAEENLRMWLEAEKAVAKGQSYTIDGRAITRVDAKVIAERIIYYEQKIRAIANRKGFRIFQGVSR